MRTPAKRNKLSTWVVCGSLLLGVTARTPAATLAPPPPETPAPSSAGTDPQVDNATESVIQGIMNSKPKEGTIGAAGKDAAEAFTTKVMALDALKTPGMDGDELRTRFTTYLNLPEVPDARIQEYFAKMSQVTETLSTGDTFGAWKILYSLGDYQDIDAGISRELAHRVEAIWNTDRTTNGLEQANDKLRGNIDTYDHNADMIAGDIKRDEQDDQRKNSSHGSSGSNSSGNSTTAGGGTSPLANINADPVAAEASIMPTMGSSLQGKMELTSEYLNLLEARAKIKLNEIREHKMDDEGKTDFGRYIKTLFATHRYYHVIIAADFYRALFSEGDYPVDMADEVNVSLETNSHVNQNVDVFKYMAAQDHIAAAAEQLQDAFIANEFHPALQGLPRDEKLKVGQFLDKLDVLKNQLEARTFEDVDAQIADIKKIASDFDATKPLALVNDMKMEAEFRLDTAKLQAQSGQLAQALDTFQTAGEDWPTNPDLKTTADTFFKRNDAANQSTAEFDRLVKDQNDRAIFDGQLGFALAVKGDPMREPQLKDALLKVQKAEVAEEKANLLVMNGDTDGAWETIEAATKDWPDDMKLNKLLADLSGRSADFVSAVNHAREAEAKKEMGYSLTWYVNAQSLYPASIIANDGIDRISKQILADQSHSTALN